MRIETSLATIAHTAGVTITIGACLEGSIHTAVSAAGGTFMAYMALSQTKYLRRHLAALARFGRPSVLQDHPRRVLAQSIGLAAGMSAAFLSNSIARIAVDPAGFGSSLPGGSQFMVTAAMATAALVVGLATRWMTLRISAPAELP